MRTILVGLVLAACTSSTLPAGAKCSATADCDKDLMCLDIGQFMGSSCMTVGKSCTVTCSGDPDCTHLGSNFKCFATCGTDKICAMVQ